MNYSGIKAYSLIQGSDASDRKPKTIVTIFFLSHIKIQVTRVVLFHETLSNAGSFQPSLCHAQSVGFILMVQDGSIWVPATRWRKGWWRRSKGHLPAMSSGSFSEAAKWHFCLHPIGQNLAAWPHEAAREAGNVEIKTWFWMILCPAKNYMTKEKQKTDVWNK